MVRWLIVRGATMQHVTRHRTTAFDWADMAGHDAVLTQLVRDYRVQTELRRLFIALARADVTTVDKIVKAGERYRLNHVATLESECVLLVVRSLVMRRGAAALSSSSLV